MKGEADPELFTEDARKEIIPRIKQAGKDGQFSAFGALKKFSLLTRKETETGVQLRYRAAFENETAEAAFTLEKNGKIAGLRLRPSEE